MAQLESLEDALMDNLRDLFSAENQLTKALPKMAKKAGSKSLRDAIETHLEETKGHVQRLQQISELLGQKVTGKTCKAMQGLIEEGKEVLEEESDNPALIDTLLIGAAQRVEHYEIAAYGTARAIATALGRDDIADILQETLDEEGAADKKLTEISEEEILEEAKNGLSASESDTESEEEELGEEPVEEEEEEPKPRSRGKKPTKR
jgi:ferritin-like metal-binding protein YciE